MRKGRKNMRKNKIEFFLFPTISIYIENQERYYFVLIHFCFFFWKAKYSDILWKMDLKSNFIHTILFSIRKKIEYRKYKRRENENIHRN